MKMLFEKNCITLNISDIRDPNVLLAVCVTAFLFFVGANYRINVINLGVKIIFLREFFPFFCYPFPL